MFKETDTKEFISESQEAFGWLADYLQINVFKAFDLCPLNKVCVVILGQDPYHSVENGTPQATGLAFSTNKGCAKQPSVSNIHKELKLEYPNFVPPHHGDLTNWATQGVLLVNSCLTVKPHAAKSHKDIWNGFMTRVFTAVNETNPECVYLLWGGVAIGKSSDLGERSIKLVATHPSSYSATTASREAPAFIGCGHFRTTNEYLVSQGRSPIDWINLD